MQVFWVTPAGVEQRPVSDLRVLLKRDDGIVWVDVPGCDGEAAEVLVDVLGCHPLAVGDCMRRNRVPRVHIYPDQAFIVLHAPERGAGGHVHYVELDQFVGERHLVTVHGPVNPAVPVEVPLRETSAVLARLRAGKLHPHTPLDLSHAVVSALAHHQEAFVERMTGEVWQLEQRVTAGVESSDPEGFLEELFAARHGLMAVKTISATTEHVYGRWVHLADGRPERDQRRLRDLLDQFERVHSLAEGEKDYLQGVIDFYRARTETKMTIAAERLTVIAVVTLPITSIASVYGMNVIVNSETEPVQLTLVLIVMAIISTVLLIWAKRRGWW
jgi:Mg2+ and Co2+ transporter CorA